ncbi:MAG: glutamyl-tRNA synthetase [Actinomycetota bacterium]|jgi:glutamyl-tRNA synthetase|nr:glutamyl-tRNA synthetase [Actinomycetota bacterium]
MSEVRVRFSPAPTGMLQMGNARTALFNWLYARHTGGTFVLRIEDTDVVRSTAAAVEQIQVVLRWLGLDWDEGPILQSTRFDRYLEAAARLREQGDAYECFCTEDEIKERNVAARAAGMVPGYDGRCRDLTPAQREAFVAEGRSPSIRFRTPDEGRSQFVDIVRGEVSVAWSTVSDFVIVRSNGTPVFFLANAVDDIDMGITHVLRGEDLLDSTHRVLALRHALGDAGQPRYAHLPLILGPGGAKLSKRHGAVSVEEYRDAGYLPAAVVNYLALLGWAPADDREVLAPDELVAAFELERVHHAAATFDEQKLAWLNGERIRMLTLSELTAAVLPFARDRYGTRLDVRVFEAAVALAQERATTLVQIADQAEFLFTPDDELVIADDSWEKVTRMEKVAEILDAAIAHLETCEWTVDGIDLRAAVDAVGVKARKALPVVYAAIEGRTAGLPLFDSIFLLGRDSALRRLRRCRERLAGA